MKSRRSSLLCVLQRFYNNGWRFSLGVTQEITPAIKLDFGYSYIVVNRMAINVVPGHPSSEQLLLPGLGQLNYFGAANLNLSVISAALRYQFGT
jgi:long-subunit fatty acid transport protein